MTRLLACSLLCASALCASLTAAQPDARGPAEGARSPATDAGVAAEPGGEPDPGPRSEGSESETDAASEAEPEPEGEATAEGAGESGPAAEGSVEEETEAGDATEADPESDAEPDAAGAAAEPDAETPAELDTDVDAADALVDEDEAPPSEPGEDTEEEDEGEDLTFGIRLGGEYRHRFVLLSDIPLEPLPRTDPADTGQLGQNWYGVQWLRLHAELTLRPILRLVGEVDALWGVAYGDLARGTEAAAWGRTDYGYPGLRLRQLYLEWLTPIGLIRVGQMAFSWGLGIVSNGGDQPPPFGDYRYGDLVRRILFATKPAGEESPFTIAVAADWVAWDLIADFERRGDLAFQGLLAAYFEHGEDRIGGYVAYRNQTNVLDDYLEVFVGDIFAILHFPEPSGGRFFGALEAAYIRGTTTIPRSLSHPVQDVEQVLAVVQLGRKHETIDVVLEGGYASGDSNTEDALQSRATFDPDHRVGLILFPEVLAMMSARSATLAQSSALFGRPARGSELLPTNGGVSGAYYFFPYTIWRPVEWLDLRFGAVVAWASSDVVDPFAQRARSESVNYRGGDPTRRDLGLELDGAVLLHGPIAEGITLSGGVEGGILFPGRAFDDAMGQPMDNVAMMRARLGLRY